jgi:hypothetical protein
MQQDAQLSYSDLAPVTSQVQVVTDMLSGHLLTGSVAITAALGSPDASSVACARRCC